MANARMPKVTWHKWLAVRLIAGSDRLLTFQGANQGAGL
jgi:hypothetical protein